MPDPLRAGAAYPGFAAVSAVLFYAIEIASQFYADLSVRHRTASESYEDIVRYTISEPTTSFILALPYIAIGLLSARVAHRASFGKAVWVFAACMLPLCGLYYSGRIDAARAVLDHKWTASALSVGLRPYFAMPIVSAGIVLQWLVVRKHRKDALAAT